VPEAGLKVLIVDENAIRASIIEAGLREAGCGEVVTVREMHGLLKRIFDVDPDVIFIDLENPNRDVLEQMFVVSRSVRRPVAMFVDRSDRAAIEAAVDAGVGAYVVDGLRQDRVQAVLDTTISRFNAFNRLREELDHTKQALAERKVIERAKGILMKLRRIDEEAAWELLRQTAMNENRRLADVAQSVLTLEHLLP
jgi:response regulator NasT